MKKEYTVVFLDLDDTILDTIKNSEESLLEIYKEYEVDRYAPSFYEFMEYYKSINSNLWKLYEQNLITKEELMKRRFLETFDKYHTITEDQSLDLNMNFLLKTSVKKNLIEGAIDVLDYLSSKYKLYIVSNGFTEIQYKKMEMVGVDKYFQGIILSDEVGKNKPHPGIFEYTLKKAGVVVNQVVMVGDNVNTDIKGAQSVGIDQIWYNPNGSSNQGIIPTYEIKSLSEIKNIL